MVFSAGCWIVAPLASSVFPLLGEVGFEAYVVFLVGGTGACPLEGGSGSCPSGRLSHVKECV